MSARAAHLISRMRAIDLSDTPASYIRLQEVVTEAIAAYRNDEITQRGASAINRESGRILREMKAQLEGAKKVAAKPKP